MAKIKFSALVSDMRGKLNGSVISKNRSGAIVRNKVTPSNPQTASQMANRALLGSASIAWGSLSQAQRDSFDNAVSQWTGTNIFGDNVTPTGKNLFVALYKNAVSVGATAPLTAPDKVEIPFNSATAVNVNIDDSEVTILGNDAPAGMKLVVSATPFLSPGTKFTKGKFRRIYVSAGNAPVPADLYASYTDKFGVPSAGANIYFEIKLIAPNGQMGLPQTFKASVA